MLVYLQENGLHTPTAGLGQDFAATQLNGTHPSAPHPETQPPPVLSVEAPSFVPSHPAANGIVTKAAGAASDQVPSADTHKGHAAKQDTAVLNGLIEPAQPVAEALAVSKIEAANGPSAALGNALAA